MSETMEETRARLDRGDVTIRETIQGLLIAKRPGCAALLQTVEGMVIGNFVDDAELMRLSTQLSTAALVKIDELRAA